MSWHSHLMCEECWNQKNPTKQTNARGRGAPCGTCCMCGRETASGIYVRGDASPSWAHCTCEKSP
jgi:hypothetical protein